ncbi:MAG: HD domain-containing phosphohydrolase [Mariprofundaceae bacterium]
MLSSQIEQIHHNLNESFPALCRIAIVLYDENTDMLKTFTHSTRGAVPIQYYSSRLGDSESLSELAKNRSTRIIDDITAITSDRDHTKRIKASGFRSSLTYPIYNKNTFVGILFMNAKEIAYFSDETVKKLSIFIQLISTLLIAETLPIKTLKGAVATAREFSRIKDEETGAHLARMSHYARIIGLEIGEQHDLNDEVIEYIFQFAPLHDVGKVGVPDSVILKQGPLTDDERTIVQTHVDIGENIINTMVDKFDLGGVENVQMLRNIVAYHHEAYDGSGYLKGLKGEEIPIEARITAVADVFDALTSKRPYKKAWTNLEAFRFLEEKKGIMFDPDCVDAMVNNKDLIQAIQERFKEDKLG